MFCFVSTYTYIRGQVSFYIPCFLFLFVFPSVAILFPLSCVYSAVSLGDRLVNEPRGRHICFLCYVFATFLPSAQVLACLSIARKARMDRIRGRGVERFGVLAG